MARKKMCCLMVLVVLCVFGLMMPPGGQAARFKVLVVMSYDETYPWVTEIRHGIDAALAGSSEIRYLYMNTKKKFEEGPKKAKQAYALYQEFQPDGVIAADDNAQSMFVVPYLKDKVKTPVMFCGLNAQAEKYGYPASNVSGILERHHVRESIAFMTQLISSVRTVGYIQKHSPSAKAMLKQIRLESDSYPAKFCGYKQPKTLNQALTMAADLKKQCDALFIETMHGVPDENGKPLTDKEIIPMVSDAFGKPTIGANLYHVRQGVLCAVIKTGQEQGETAAEMLLKAMRGTPVSQIPITRNQHGQRVINMTVMKAMKIIPQPIALRNTKIVKTED